jgi:type II secretory pathway pseudopilin PulG
VEMLTVIVIIGILVGLTVAGAIAARNAVRRGIVIADMKQLEMGLQKYKSEVGELPPDFALVAVSPVARARVVRHLRKAFPRMRLSGTTDDQFRTFVIAATDLTDDTGLNPYSLPKAAERLNPSTALTFWLGGIPDSDGKPRGFHDDPTNPFKLGEPRSKPYYDFDTERLNTGRLMQPGIRPASPYVYFRAVKDSDSGRFEYGVTSGASFMPYLFAFSTDNICVPYLEDCIPPSASDPPDPALAAHRRVWRAPESYQIIAAGLDGVFSTNTPAAPLPFRYSKLGENFTDGDYDNLASFAEGELESEL